MLGRLYYTTKLRINALADTLIHRSEMALETSTRLQNPLLRQTITACASATANFCHLVKQLPRLDAVRVTGTLGSLIYVGEQDGHAIGLFETLFPEGYEQADLGRIPLWKLPTLTQTWLQENDLVICRVSQFFPWHIPAAYTFHSPLRVWQILTLYGSLEDLKTSGITKRFRKRINRALRSNFSYRISHSPQDLQRFYQQMYVPTAQKRFQNQAMILPYKYFEDQLENGFLLLLQLDQQDVAGDFFVIKDDICNDKFMGYLDGEPIHDIDINTALYWYVIEYASHQGVREINFEGSFGWVSDGVFTYKRRWGAKVQADPGDRDQLLFRAQDLSVEWREHLNNIGFITSNRGQYLRIFIDGTNPAPIEEGIEDAANQGLDGIQIVSANHRKNHVQPSLQSASTISS